MKWSRIITALIKYDSSPGTLAGFYLVWDRGFSSISRMQWNCIAWYQSRASEDARHSTVFSTSIRYKAHYNFVHFSSRFRKSKGDHIKKLTNRQKKQKTKLQDSLDRLELHTTFCTIKYSAINIIVKDKTKIAVDIF